MRVAVVTESFLPQVNGVTHSVLRVLEHLRDNGHEAIVLAPSAGGRAPARYAGFPVVHLPSVAMPGYASFRVATTPQWLIERELSAFAPDVVHLAAPFAMGQRALAAARRLDLPTVAIYQTEIPTYAARYGLPQAEPLLWKWVRNVHQLATMTLAPSRAARKQLIDIGVRRVGLWGRGVDSVRFHPAKRDKAFRRRYARRGEMLIGYVGRLAPEKQVDDLEVLADLPGTRTVIIGEGPRRAELEQILPHAVFLGQRTGDELPRALASMDLFVHPGELETFCQSIQEAQASGVPTIAPARGGPIDLIDPSRTGWLYSPGDLAGMRAHVRDLLGDDRKRANFGAAARAAVEHRTWPYMCDRLLGHYAEAIAEHRAQRASLPF
ncbi:glycosyltransferase [Naumannella cuiyingiana]|uniref:Phosphatidylinositol alpha 1,6-mannosyltransferase n=1 Tax=Naumannella cuiyingiana TaxID=1347891 RepID=A0A7Z0D7L5_9ACTN|nr:phosphatidylinositol alpha 1,6-mannosyltransferase [Naumannella cuiyingiana]